MARNTNAYQKKQAALNAENNAINKKIREAFKYKGANGTFILIAIERNDDEFIGYYQNPDYYKHITSIETDMCLDLFNKNEQYEIRSPKHLSIKLIYDQLPDAFKYAIKRFPKETFITMQQARYEAFLNQA